MSRPLCWSLSVVKRLELWSACFGRYWRNWLSFTALKTDFWHLKTVYCQLDNLWRWSVPKWQQLKMSFLTATTSISTHGAIWSYPGCWHQMYINKSTWLKCWANVKFMLCSVTLAHLVPLPGSLGGISHDRSVWPKHSPNVKVTWPKGWPNFKLTWCSATHAH